MKEKTDRIDKVRERNSQEIEELKYQNEEMEKKIKLISSLVNGGSTNYKMIL